MGARVTGEKIYIDEVISKDSKSKWKDLDIACTDYKDTNDMASQPWIMNNLKMHEISDKIINSFTEALKTWEVE